jgi:hypothetical protein
MSNSKPPVFDEFYAAANSYCSFYMREQRCRRSMPNNVRLYAGKVFGSHAENMVAVRVPTNTGNVYVLRGTIEKGDFRKVRDFYRANHKELSNFYLISGGGNVDEAIQVGRLLKGRQRTRGPDTCLPCASSSARASCKRVKAKESQCGCPCLDALGL